jgi:cold shock CspA family protein
LHVLNADSLVIDKTTDSLAELIRIVNYVFAKSPELVRELSEIYSYATEQNAPFSLSTKWNFVKTNASKLMNSLRQSAIQIPAIFESSAEQLSDPYEQAGVVRTWNPEGYGFIRPNGPEMDDVYFTRSALVFRIEEKQLHPGTKVVFAELSDEPKGLRAFTVSLSR